MADPAFERWAHRWGRHLTGRDQTAAFHSDRRVKSVLRRCRWLLIVNVVLLLVAVFVGMLAFGWPAYVIAAVALANTLGLFIGDLIGAQ